MKPKNQNKSPKNIANPFETVRGILQDTSSQIKDDVLKGIPESFIEQLLGLKREKVPKEIRQGETLYIGGEPQDEKRLKQIRMENEIHKRLKVEREQEKIRTQKQIEALSLEIKMLASSLKGLQEEVKAAEVNENTEYGTYHKNFLEKLISFVRSFREKIDDSIFWLKVFRERKRKKDFWARCKKEGTSFFLSPESYISRATA